VEVLPENVLGQIYEFTPLRRILLATTGTLQGTLSAFFGVPVSVELTNQELMERGNPKIWIRQVELRTPDKVVVRADSSLRVSNEEVNDFLSAGRMGIGQILLHLGIKPEFELQEVWTDEGEFCRKYALTAEGIAYYISERFPEELYP
jgi:chorismate-pyruvate lyase